MPLRTSSSTKGKIPVILSQWILPDEIIRPRGRLTRGLISSTQCTNHFPPDKCIEPDTESSITVDSKAEVQTSPNKKVLVARQMRLRKEHSREALDSLRRASVS